MSSTRLPGKVLAEVVGRPLLALQLERVARAKRIDHIVVATSTDSSDAVIQELCEHLGVSCYRGDLFDVLSRFYHAAITFKAEHIVRLTADCPLIDPVVIDAIIQFYFQGNYDYASNTVVRTFPDGLDVEMFRFGCLRDAFQEAARPFEREHVTPFIYQRPSRYRLGKYVARCDLSDLRWTLDTDIDLKLIRSVYESLYPINAEFSTEDIISFLGANLPDKRATGGV